MHMNHYGRLAAMTVLSFLAMYVLMYAMVDRFGNVYSNVNQVYMAGLMAAPMVLIELLLMGDCTKTGPRISRLQLQGVVAAIVFVPIRQQALVGDTQFLRSMIPHHPSAILMCEKAPIADAEIKKLCGGIIASQQAEIDQMKSKLSQLAR